MSTPNEDKATAVAPSPQRSAKDDHLAVRLEGMRLRVADLNPLIDPADPLRTMVHVGAVLESLADSLKDMQQLPDLWGIGLALRCAQCALQFHREFGGPGPESVVVVRGR